MNTFYLLKLQNNSNTVIAECRRNTLEEAVKRFNSAVTLQTPSGVAEPIQLDAHGYRKGDPQVGDSITYCVAVAHQNIGTL